MRYTRFEITNYKGITKTHIDLGEKNRRPVVTLIGLNESGKTTLLEAISSFTYGREDVSHLEIYGYRPPEWFDIVPVALRSNFNDQISISAHVTLDAEDIRSLSDHMQSVHQVKISSIPDRFIISDIRSFKDSRHDPTKDKRRTWTNFSFVTRKIGERGRGRKISASSPEWRAAVQFIGERAPQIWYFPNFLFDFPNRIYLEDNPALQGQKAERNAFFRGLVQSILHEVDPAATIESHLIRRAKSSESSERKALEGTCLKISRHLTQTVYASWNDAMHNTSGLRDIRFQVSADDQSKAFASISLEDHDGVFDIADRSLGFRWFFVFTLISRYVASDNPGSAGMLMLLDEPASNLHSSAQRRLLKYFELLSKNSTLIYATHSPHLIKPDWLEAAYVIKNSGLSGQTFDITYNRQRSRIDAIPYRRFVADHPDQRAYFQPALDALDVSPSLVELSSRLVLCEGKSDYYILRLIAKLLDADLAGIRLYPGGGAGTLDSVIGMCLAWGYDFIVVLDGDTEGEKQRSRYEERFPAISNRLYSLDEVSGDSSVRYGENLLSPDEQKLLVHEIFGTEAKVSKKTLMMAAWKCATTNKSIDLSESTKDVGTRVLSFFKTRLASS